MSNVNDDQREGYITSGNTVARNCSSLASGAQTQGNVNDLVDRANVLVSLDEVKNIIPI